VGKAVEVRSGCGLDRRVYAIAIATRPVGICVLLRTLTKHRVSGVDDRACCCHDLPAVIDMVITYPGIKGWPVGGACLPT
jgi:hypothetical protein